MKILQISRQFSPSIGGIESVTQGLGKSLVQNGHHSCVVTLSSIFNSNIVTEPSEIIDGIDIYRIPHVGIQRYPVAPSVINFLSPFDIVHIHGIDFFIDYLTAARKWHDKPLVVNTHGGIFHTRWFPSFKRFYFNNITRKSLAKVDAIICDSKHDYELFSNIALIDKMYIIENGINIEPFLKINKIVKKGMLLGIGRIAENKCIDQVIKLIPQLADKYHDTHLVWIGEDIEDRIPSLLKLAHDIGVENRIKFLGKVSIDDIYLQLKLAHVFVSAASYEAFGISTIEAMSSSTVPVVTPVGIHPQVVQDGLNGFITSFNDNQTISTLYNVLTLPFPELYEIGQRARDITLQYSWSNIVKKYVKIYQMVMLNHK